MNQLNKREQSIKIPEPDYNLITLENLDINKSDDSIAPSLSQEAKNKNEFFTIEECQPVKELRYRMRDPKVHIFFKTEATHLNSPSGPLPHPDFDSCQWLPDDSNLRVVLPFSRSNKKENKNWHGKTIYNWQIMTKELQKLTDLTKIKSVIEKYNEEIKDFDFSVFIEFFENPLMFDGSKQILQEIINSCPLLYNEITKPLPLLRQNNSATIYLSRKQIAYLLSNAFFCTFPTKTTKSQMCGQFNFASLFSSESSKDKELKLEKLKCIMNYFKNVLKGDAIKGVVSFERRSISNFPDWQNSKKEFAPIKLELQGKIEDEGHDFSEVDFANKFVGGGVLGSGSLQEEIKFLICPELIVSRLFTEYLEDNEALIITGCAQFNKYRGYGKTFKWDGNFNETAKFDNLGRIQQQVIIIDALHFKPDQKNEQYKEKSITREINKAYVGFFDDVKYKHGRKPSIATGKWGCGAFNGDPHLKILIQWIASSEAERGLIVYTFNDKPLVDQFEDLVNLIKKKKLRIKDLYKVIVENEYNPEIHENYSQFLKGKLNNIEYL